VIRLRKQLIYKEAIRTRQGLSFKSRSTPDLAAGRSSETDLPKIDM
jgi:hypothetical protein